MGRRVQYSVPDLHRLWADESLTRAEIARELGVTAGQLTQLASRHGLPARGRQSRAFSMADPTPDEIMQRACRAIDRSQLLEEAAAEIERLLNNAAAYTIGISAGCKSQTLADAERAAITVACGDSSQWGRPHVATLMRLLERTM